MEDASFFCSRCVVTSIRMLVLCMHTRLAAVHAPAEHVLPLPGRGRRLRVRPVIRRPVRERANLSVGAVSLRPDLSRQRAPPEPSPHRHARLDVEPAGTAGQGGGRLDPTAVASSAGSGRALLGLGLLRQRLQRAQHGRPHVTVLGEQDSVQGPERLSRRLGDLVRVPDRRARTARQQVDRLGSGRVGTVRNAKARPGSASTTSQTRRHRATPDRLWPRKRAPATASRAPSSHTT